MNEIARRHGKVFFWAGSHAEEGWFVADFGKVGLITSRHSDFFPKFLRTVCSVLHCIVSVAFHYSAMLICWHSTSSPAESYWHSFFSYCLAI